MLVANTINPKEQIRKGVMKSRNILDFMASGSPYFPLDNHTPLPSLCSWTGPRCLKTDPVPWTPRAQELWAPLLPLLIIWMDSQPGGALNFLLGSGSNENKSQ